MCSTQLCYVEIVVAAKLLCRHGYRCCSACWTPFTHLGMAWRWYRCTETLVLCNRRHGLLIRASCDLPCCDCFDLHVLQLIQSKFAGNELGVLCDVGTQCSTINGCELLHCLVKRATKPRGSMVVVACIAADCRPRATSAAVLHVMRPSMRCCVNNAWRQYMHVTRPRLQGTHAA